MPLGVDFSLFARVGNKNGKMLKMAKRVLFGLYGNQHPHFVRVRAKGKFWGRPWIVKKRDPNVQTKRLFSEILGRFIQLRVTTRVIKTLDKYGGLDNYLMRTPLHRLNSKVGMYWRYQIMETLKARLAAYQASLGVQQRGLAASGVQQGAGGQGAAAAAAGGKAGAEARP